MSKKINYGSRNAPSAYMANKDRDFHDDYGVLKKGYNTSGGEGMVAVGTTIVTGTVGAGKDGMRGYSEEKTVFGPKDTSEDTTPNVGESVAESPKPEVKTSVESTAARATAKERTQKFKAELDGTMGSDFSAV